VELSVDLIASERPSVSSSGNSHAHVVSNSSSGRSPAWPASASSAPGS